MDHTESESPNDQTYNSRKNNY